jgi:hypothetical protein
MHAFKAQTAVCAYFDGTEVGFKSNSPGFVFFHTKLRGASLAKCVTMPLSVYATSDAIRLCLGRC